MADVYRDFVYTRNTVAVDDVGTTITVEDVSLFPQSLLTKKQDFYVTFESALSYPHTFEIMKVVKVDTALKQLEVVRGQGGTTAVPHSIATYIKGTLTADMLRRLRSGLVGRQLPPNDADGLVAGDRFYHQDERRFYVWTGVTGQLRDSFTRPNSTTTLGSTEIGSPATGSAAATATPWTNVFGVFGIDGNAAKAVSVDATRQEAVVITNAGGHDVDMSVDITLPAAGETGEGGLVFRSDPNGLSGYLVVLQKTAVTLYRKNNGTYTQITTAAHTYADAQTVRLRVVANGNGMNIYTDGAHRFGYTEVSAGFTVGTGYSSIGTNVGFRTYDNGTTYLSTQSATLRWDNFSVDHPTSAVGGWQPVSESTDVALRQGQQYGTQITTIARQLDELLPVVQDDERNTIVERRDTAILVNQASDLHAALADAEFASVHKARADTLVAATLDEVVEILKGALATGYGPPSGVPADGWLYLDRSGKRIYIGEKGSWLPLTYSGPGTFLPPVQTSSASYRGNYGSFTIPSTAKIGDTALAWFNTVHTSAAVAAPVGWTVLRQSQVAGYNWQSVCLASKVLTQDDLNTTHAFGMTVNPSVVHLRTYSGKFESLQYQAGASGGTGTYYTAPDITTTKPDSRVITWFSSGVLYGSAEITAPVQENPVSTSNADSYHSQMSQDEYVAAAGTTVTGRQFRQTYAYSTNSWAVASLVIAPMAVDSPQGLYTGVGVPILTEGVFENALYVDKNSSAVYVFRDGEWGGFQANVRSTSMKEIVARNRDYLLLSPSLGVAEYETFAYRTDNAGISLTSAKRAVILAFRGIWGNYALTASLNSTPMTLRAERYNNSKSAVFSSGAVNEPATHSLVYSTAGDYSIHCNAAVSVISESPDLITYHQVAANSMTITVPDSGCLLVIYAHVNGGTVPSVASTTAGVTWTRVAGAAFGSQNASGLFIGNVPEGLTSVAVTFTPNDTSYGTTVGAMIPSGGGQLATVILPAGARHAQVFVQNNDPNGAEIRVVPASGTINGAASHLLGTRYSGGIYSSDGVDWFLLSTGGGGGAGTVTAKTADYTAKAGEAVLADATAASFTVTLPAVAANAAVTVKKVDTSGNTVSVATQSGLIDGATSPLVISAPYESLDFLCDGTNWWLI